MRWVTVLAMALCAGLIGWLRQSEPKLLGRATPDPLTGVLHALVGTAAWLGLVMTLSRLLGATVLGRARDVGDPTRSIGRPTWAMSQIWTVAALLMVPLEAADSSGLSLAQVLGDISTHLTSTPSVTAWFVMAVIGLITSLVSLLTRTMGALLLLAVAVTGSAVPVVVTGSVSVGLNHDFSTDAGAVSMIALVLAAAVTVARALPADHSRPEAVAGRTRGPVMVCLAVALAGQLVVWWQGLAGVSPLSTRWGVARLMLLLALALWLAARVVGRRGLLIVEVVCAAVAITVTGASGQLVPPRYLVPQTPVVNYLGYPLPPRPTVASLVLPGRPNLLMLVLAVAGVASYLLAVRRIRRGGLPWQAGRTIAWIIGWFIVAYLASAGLWSASSIMFSWHMLVHMLFNMLVPALLVMGAPTTLLRQVLDSGRDELMNPRAILDSLLNWGPMKILFGPFIGWAVFVASFYVVYFTPVFGWLMRYHWGHQWMLLHFMAAGLLLFEFVIGLDELPSSLPHIGRLGFVITAMPFHSFFAVITMGAHQIIGRDYYLTLAVPWIHDLAANQNLGGQITWATGEPPMAVVLLALCVQWFLSDRRDQRRLDEAEDEGLEDSLAAYNEMLARMAGQDAVAEAEDAARAHRDRSGSEPEDGAPRP
ncbi:cytochrome c oxidase assembly protein [Acidipropionibacterium acidipropionici]|uniref:Permease n=1 Tax=Acidipropionibacterium acidipropionici TaxID=1748 RepID=A0AAC8YII4_9ACTN|nr:permease [Acidipropionibacterium acidipropionici]AZP39508.1 cytochrome c oxidase assembly protein [Acidipropionibacterium acidipropionici]